MTRRRVASGLGAGLCLTLAMPPHGHTALGLGTFALLAVALRGATPRDAAIALWSGGALAFLATGPWLVTTVARFLGVPWPVGLAAHLAACAWMALAWALLGYLAARTAPLLGAPLASGLSAWAALRYGPRLFPFPLALPLIDLPALPQCAELLGVEGLGATLLAVASLAASAVARRRWSGVLAAVAVLLVAGGVGAWREGTVRRARAEAPSWRVVLVQPAMGARLRWDPDLKVAAARRLAALSEEGVRANAVAGAATDLVIWHEAAHPEEIGFEAPREADPQRDPAWPYEGRPALLFGAMARPADPADPRRFNAAVLREGGPRGRVLAAVGKRVLLPFGEFVPVVAWSPSWHARWTGGAGVSPGPRAQRIRLGRNEIGVLNCFEDTVPEAGAELAGVDLLVNLTNDAWFDGANNAQHVLAARWRALELRRDLVRASNEGASGHIDALGREVLRAPQGVMGAWPASPRLIRGVPSGAAFAMVWGPRASLVVLACACLVARRRERQR